MRLQLQILRHSLPPVNIIHNTTSGPSPVKTISELLNAVDQLVPLESADGEWGLEDYVVEVAATSDQDHLYECLHYQFIEDVFKEDDEVTIRGLASDEIRERRQGGRLQILPDGRHLFDGVAWGRRHNALATRPGIIIPPRKRKRLLPPAEDNTEQIEEQLRLMSAASTAQIGTIIDSYDEEDADEDYVDEDDSEEEEDVEDLDNQPLQIVARADFDGIDTDSETDGDDSDSDRQLTDVINDDELKFLLQEAGDIEQTYQSLPLKARVTSPPKKRKRSETDDDQLQPQDVVFEGFSTPAKEVNHLPSDRKQLTEQVQGVIGDHIVTQPLSGSGFLVSNRYDSLPNGHRTNGHERSSQQVAQTRSEDNKSGLAESTSSSDISDSDSDSASDSSDDSSDDESMSSSGASISDSESETNSDKSSSSGESESESETAATHKEQVALATEQHAQRAELNPQNSHSELTTILKVDNPPGTGTKRTRANNHRVKCRKRLASLKAQGILPPAANFEDLRIYERDANSDDEVDAQEVEDTSLESKLLQRKEELLERLNTVYDDDRQKETSRTETDTVQASTVQTQQAIDEHDLSAELPVVSSQIEKQVKSPGTSSRRARLDIESTRRMLFGSLGLRNPKTPAAEQAIREKLAKPVRQVQTRRVDQDSPEVTALNENSWENKLIISAVECVQEGLVLSPPPFPFKQRWERGTQKQRARNSSHSYHQDNDDEMEAESSLLHKVVQMEVVIPSSDQPSVTDNPADADEPPYPSDIASLANLSRDDIRLDTVIAYKQLRLGANFEPEESPYQIARIVAINDDLIDVILSKRDRVRESSAQYDEETGKRVYNKFEMPADENAVEDDGLRETTFDDMIQPKLVRRAKSHPPTIDRNPGTVAADPANSGDVDMVPESGPQQAPPATSVYKDIEVNTPRRNEITNIIHNAGFNSMVDEKLLEPIGMSQTQHAEPKSAQKSEKRRGKETSSSSLTRTAHADMDKNLESSPFEPDADNTSQLQGVGDSIVGVSHSSPPSVSMVETVDYPHVSHIDMNQSSLTGKGASSSHQDAQRVSPGLTDIEESGLSHLLDGRPSRLIHEDSQNSSLPSSVPMSQPSVLSAIQNEESSNIPMRDRGGDGAAEMDDGYRSDEFDSDNLPTLQALTSSQKLRLSSNRDQKPMTALSNVSYRVSPPPVRRKRTRIESSEEISSRQSRSKSPEIKISASQKATTTVNIADIPENNNNNNNNNNTIVDLTVSSDPVEASNDDHEDHNNRNRDEGASDSVDYNEDEDYDEDDDEYQDSPRARRAAARNASQSQGQKERISSTSTVRRTLKGGGGGSGGSSGGLLANISRKNRGGKNRSRI